MADRITFVFHASHRAGSTHPCPLARGRIELPKVIEVTVVSGSVVAVAPEEPEITAAVSPGHSVIPGSGEVSGRRSTQRAVHPRLTTIAAERVAPAHPGPIACATSSCQSDGVGSGRYDAGGIAVGRRDRPQRFRR